TNASIRYAQSDIELVQQLHRDPDIELVFLNPDLPGSHTAQLLDKLKKNYSSVRIAMISATADAINVSHCRDHGAISYIPKDTPYKDMIQALEKIIRGDNFYPAHTKDSVPAVAEDDVSKDIEHSLTARQHEILCLLRRGYSNKEIARRLNISQHTIKTHIVAILQRLGVRNRTEAVAWAGEHKMCAKTGSVSG
ncbi:MAG: response regulator transcription factor, partial [Gammaproteobacteria bacterium]|nr:response regulator transcription factor [Gammaproteobacteria bacterium]